MASTKQDTAKTTGSPEGGEPVKRGRGRPPLPPGQRKTKPEPSGRPRGRPPGSGVKKSAATPKKPATKGARASKRIEEAANDALAENGETKATPTGKRGRPAKGAAAAAKGSAKKAVGGKRGRPSKASEAEAEAEAEAEEEEEQEQVEEEEEDLSDELDEDEE